MAKKDNFATIKNILNDCGHNEFDEMLDHEIELLTRKRASVNSKAQAETAARMEKVYNALAEMDKAVQVSELKKLTSDEEVAEYNGQRITALLGKLVNSGRAIRTEVKGKAFYSIA